MYLPFNWPLLHKGWGNDKDQIVYITTFKTQWKLKWTKVIFHVYITHTWTNIWNWLSIIVASFALKKTNLPPTTTLWVFFKTCSHIQFAISQHAPSNQCFMGLLRTFNCTNNLCVVVYFVMKEPWLSKWKIKANWTSFFFLSI